MSEELTIVTQRIYPSNIIDIFGIFDTPELAEIEVCKAVKAVCATKLNAQTTRDSQGNYTVRFGYSTDECIQFHFSTVEKNKQLSRTHTGNYAVLKENGWKTTNKGVFMWR